MRFDNNAVYRPGATAFNAQGLSAGNARANYFQGSGQTADGLAFLAGGESTSVFVHPAGRNLWLLPGGR